VKEKRRRDEDASQASGDTHFRVRVAELDRDVPDELVLEPDGHDARDRLHDRRLSVCDVPDRAQVYCRLSAVLSISTRALHPFLSLPP
jgi:hypothetical protein